MFAAIESQKANLTPKVEEKSTLSEASKAGVGESASAITPQQQKPVSTGLRGFLEALPVVGHLIKRFIDFIIGLFSSPEKKKELPPKPADLESPKDDKITPPPVEPKKALEEFKITPSAQAQKELTEASNSLNELAPLPTEGKQWDAKTMARGAYRDCIAGIIDADKREEKRKRALTTISALTEELCTEVEQAMDRKSKAAQALKDLKNKEAGERLSKK